MFDGQSFPADFERQVDIVIDFSFFSFEYQPKTKYSYM